MTLSTIFRSFVLFVLVALVASVFAFPEAHGQHLSGHHARRASFRPRVKRASPSVELVQSGNTTNGNISTAMLSALSPSINLNLFSTTISSLSSTKVTILTNETHALYSLRLASKLTAANPSAFGYIALGMGGSSMSTATQMIIAYPDSSRSNSGGWAVSSRRAGGHSEPSAALSKAAPPTILADPSTAPNTLSFVLPLNRSSNIGQSLVYAYSSQAVETSTNPDEAQIHQHDGGSFGSLTADLSKSIASGGGSTGKSTYTRYDLVIIAHAICGAAAWSVIAPAAVLIARLGRSWGKVWFRLHSMFQVLLTVVLTVTAVILAAVAVNMNGGFTAGTHQIMGFFLLILVLGQVTLGQYIHVKIDTQRTKRPPRNVVHILLGITLLILGYAQVFSGLKVYHKQRPDLVAGYFFTLFWILVIGPLALYAISCALLAFERRKTGLSWKMAAFGLGREGGSHTLKRGISSTDFAGKNIDSIEKDLETGVIVVSEANQSEGAPRKFSLSGLFKGKDAPSSGGKVSPFGYEAQAHESWGNGIVEKESLRAFQQGDQSSQRSVTPIADAYSQPVQGNPKTQAYDPSGGLREFVLRPQVNPSQREHQAYLSGERTMPQPMRMNSNAAPPPTAPRRPGQYLSEEEYRQIQQRYVASPAAPRPPQSQPSSQRRELPTATLNVGRASPAGSSRVHQHSGSSAGSISGASDSSSSSAGSRRPLAPTQRSFYQQPQRTFDRSHEAQQQYSRSIQQQYLRDAGSNTTDAFGFAR